jgi:hypothetical protein
MLIIILTYLTTTRILARPLQGSGCVPLARARGQVLQRRPQDAKFEKP